MKVAAHVAPWIAGHPRLMMQVLGLYARLHGCSVSSSGEVLRISRGARSVLLRREHAPYVRDVVDEFDIYFGSVESGPGADGRQTVDFSQVREQLVTGWDLFPLLVPGLPDPISTVRQYVDLTELGRGDTVLDLGAYAGLTAMVFQEVVGDTGRVVAVEADPVNANCARTNLERYAQCRGKSPDLIEAAVWSQSGSVSFTAESSLGSAVTQVLPRAKASTIEVPALTLSELVARVGVGHVDIIKADIEGAEFQAFSDTEFFRDNHPVIVFEPAETSAPETQLPQLSRLLSSYGYVLHVVPQTGSRLPLVVCR